MEVLAGSARRFVLVCALACTVAGAATAGSAMPYHDMLHALYVVDHNGANPQSDLALVPYSNSFQKILGACHTGPEALTMIAINLSEQASSVGARNVTTLMMLNGIARRITWRTPHNCSYVYSVTEAHLEAGEK